MSKKEVSFLSLFNKNKPIIGMIHLKGSDRLKVLKRAIMEINLYIENEIDAIIVENYFGDTYDVEQVLKELYQNKKEIIYGVNILGDYVKAFDLANKYKADFIQVDSIVGHLNKTEDEIFDNKIKKLKINSVSFLIGGVRFKYQPYLSKRTLKDDLIIGKNRCEAIVVSGEGTGIETELMKIKKFRKIVGDFPLIIGAGLTANNCEEQLEIADAGIVGSYLKTNYKDYGEVSIKNTREFMDKVKKLRKDKI